mmetsp:Transcript_4260/g.6711  ORF Transcript_4260/g.6711 Transcript_4260/m.6711 type:complete len:90 (+) Transcript_4260:340-609(+)
MLAKKGTWRKIVEEKMLECLKCFGSSFGCLLSTLKVIYMPLSSSFCLCSSLKQGENRLKNAEHLEILLASRAIIFGCLVFNCLPFLTFT